jgi:hypothetical protein
VIQYMNSATMEVIGGDPQQVESDIALAVKKAAEKAASSQRSTWALMAAVAGVWYWFKRRKGAASQ